jgi:hypothetical protein
MEEHQLQELTDQDNIDDTPYQQGWWDDTDVTRLIDLEDFCCFLYSCDQLLENSHSDSDNDEAILCTSGPNTESSLDKKPKLEQSPPTKG